jgi:hypothetical protein
MCLRIGIGATRTVPGHFGSGRIGGRLMLDLERARSGSAGEVGRTGEAPASIFAIRHAVDPSVEWGEKTASENILRAIVEPASNIRCQTMGHPAEILISASK